jgi:hypothetical protein
MSETGHNSTERLGASSGLHAYYITLCKKLIDFQGSNIANAKGAVSKFSQDTAI